jgi:hypothetical protein
MISLIAVLSFYYANISSTSSPQIIKDYAVVESLIAGKDPQVITTVIDRESGFVPTKVHYNDGKKGCNSVGLAQIRDCDHKDISYEQATNPIFAVSFLINNLDKCKTWWKATCGDLSPQ